MKKYTVPNFYADMNAMNCILRTVELCEDSEEIDLTLDLTDIPFYLVYTSDDKSYVLKAFKRLQMYRHTEDGIEVGSLIEKKGSDNLEISAIEFLSDNMESLYMVCRKISQLISDNKLQTVYEGFDPEEKGIMLEEDNGKVVFKVVSGRQRPDMQSYTLLNDIELCRPYMDEVFEADGLKNKSIEEQEKEAQEGNITAMKNVALAYLNGDEVDNNPEKAAFWMEKAAENNDTEAIFNIGLFYAKGHGVKRDFEKATGWMKRALELGDSDAKEPYELYSSMSANYEQAKKGNAQAQADLSAGLMSIGGSLDQAGAGNDYKESVKWAKKAVEQGNGDGMWNLALAYEHGRGVRRSIKKAIELYRQGAEIDNAKCQHNLAYCYLRGDIENVDEWDEDGQKKAFDLLLKSAEKGYGLAMRDVGRCYQFATGTECDMKKAVEWYEKACKVIDDPELEMKTAHFKMMLELEDDNGNNDDELEDADSNDLDDSEDGLLDAVFAALDYETELEREGYLPDGPHGIEAGRQYYRLRKKAEEGDEKAIRLLKAVED